MKASLQVQSQTMDDALKSQLMSPMPQFHLQASERIGPLDFTFEAGNNSGTTTLNVSVEDIPDGDATSGDVNLRTVADAVAVYKQNHPRTRYFPVRSTAKSPKEQKGTSSRKGRGSKYLH
ncbi:MAG: hypothetical protein OXF79_12890 [Chloroflexi bacterium]|nr:hypothetical protein [Chloroflexota bacterium]